MINAWAKGGDIAEESATHGIKASKAASNNLLIAQHLIEYLSGSHIRQSLTSQPENHLVSLLCFKLFQYFFYQPIVTILHDNC